jgi:hypothetical protein
MQQEIDEAITVQDEYCEILDKIKCEEQAPGKDKT